MRTLQSQIAAFLAKPAPSTLIVVGESATGEILTAFAHSGTLLTTQKELLGACIASNTVAAAETEKADEKSYFLTTSRLLSEIKTEIGSR